MCNFSLKQKGGICLEKASKYIASSMGSDFPEQLENLKKANNFPHSGCLRNRENREFGSYFFQTGKTQGILFWHRENI